MSRRKTKHQAPSAAKELLLRYLCGALFFVLLSSAFSSGGIQITPTTTLAAETGNNTSAVNSFNLTSNGNAAPGNVSKLPTRDLLYPGSTTKLYAQIQGWFGAANHMNVGYRSNDPAQVRRQVVDAISRGFDGFILDWYGPDKDPITNEMAHLLRREAELHPGFTFAIQEDMGALWSCYNTPGCDLTGRLIYDLNYAYYNFENSPAYQRINGRPVVYLFDITVPVDWNRVRQYTLGNPILVDRSTSGRNAFSDWWLEGSFAWPIINLSNQYDWGQDYLWRFYTNGKASGKYTLGSAYKGFNDNLAAWTLHRVVSQQCGATWVNTFRQVANSYSSALQLGALQVSTWNDYEEGSEIETGIDNCLRVSASLSGSTLYFWPSGAGNESLTVDHYTIFVSLDGFNLMKLTDVAAGARSLNLASYNFSPGTYYFYVKMQGRPGFLNRMSGAVKYTIGGATNSISISTPAANAYTGSPIQVAVSATAANAPVKVMQIYLDGVKVADTFSNAISAAVNAAAGAHQLTVQAYDANYEYFSSTRTVNVYANKVTIASPANGSSVSSGPIQVVASAAATSMPVKVMQIYLDGNKVFEAMNAAKIDTWVPASRGRWHQVIVQAYDANYKYFNAVTNVYVY
ncbi:MAG: Ig-like domain-containing protein [Terriglobales bacterium]